MKDRQNHQLSLSQEERAQVLFEFNKTRGDYPRNKTLHQLFTEQVERTPDLIAIVGGWHLEDGNNAALTYRKLNEKATQLAQGLLEKGVNPDTIVGIMVERSIEMVIGILGILKAGAAYLPIEPDYPQERINYILKDSNARILLTQKDIESYPSTLTSTSTCQVGPANLAYIIYTSGSTGKPKGVMVEHLSAVNILSALFKTYPFTQTHRYLLKTSYTFDVSVSELFGWFFGGGRCIILAPDLHKDPAKILEAIEYERITHINFVPSMFGAFIHRLEEQNIRKLSSLEYIFLAGEALPSYQVKKFRDLNTPIALENLYGPTEGTIYASGYSLSQWKGNGNIPIGKPLRNVKLYILDSNRCPVPIGISGELFIAGHGVARGYLSNPELTHEKFDHDLWGYLDYHDGDGCHRSYKSYKSYILYRTGDLARWLPDGNIEFLGRKDHQVKIRGFRIELGEIENHLLRHEKVKETTVVAYSGEDGQGTLPLDPADKYLCAYIVTAKETPFAQNPGIAEELKEYLSRLLPDYMIPTYFIQLDNIPLTPSDKINRKALPLPEIRAAGKRTAPRDEIEKKLTEIWAQVLIRNADPLAIGIDDNFLNLGGHSLKATLMTAKIHKELNINLTLAEVFKTPTVRSLAQYIRGMNPEKYQAVKTIEKKEYYSLSSAQKRLYILDRMEFASTSYNIPTVYQLAEEPDRSRLEQAFRQLVQQHESFRTSFIMLDDEPVQKIHDKVELKIEYYEKEVEVEDEKQTTDDRRQKTEEKRKTTDDRPGAHLSSVYRHLSSEFIRPFDLSTAPLLRAELIKIQKAKPLLLVDMHHIISDGMSIDIFKKELTERYDKKELPPFKIQYKDYAQWQQKERQYQKFKNQEEYWLREFEGEIPVLNLPTDFPRPAIQSFAGNTLSFELGKEQTRALNQLAAAEQATLFMVLFAIFNILLAKLSGQENIILGTPTAGRRHADLENIIGMFVNTLALKNYPYAEKKFNEFLTSIKIKTFETFENQEYQFEDLVELLNVERDAGRNPLFDVVFVLQNMEEKDTHQPGLEMTPFKYLSNTAKFDLTLITEEKEEELSFDLEYCTRLFKEETMVKFTKYFQNIVSSVLENPKKKISGIEIILPEEKEQILFDFNNTSTVYPKDKTIHELFEKQAEKTPDNIAIVGSHEGTRGLAPLYITYKQLNQQANQLSYLLIEKGVHPDTIIAIMLERSIEMIVGVLAILKAGGAYLPIAPDYPPERINYILKDSNACLLLTHKDIEPSSSTITSTSICQVGPANLAYIIYTSGTTGGPKGAMVKHLNVVRLVKNTNFIQLEEFDRILQTGALEFDASTFEIWGSLLNGLELYLVSKEIILSPLKLKETLQKHKITVIWLTAPLFNQLLDEEIEIFRGLKSLLVGGDVLSPPHINRLRKQFPQLNIINGYGPTENTTFSTTFLIDKEYKRNIPIGKPIANSTVYIVDRFNKILPIGTPGELIVGGDGVARGYLNNPELTAEKFDHDLWDYKDYHDGYNKSYRTYRSYLLYRTGDLAKWLPDGNIEFIGRVDFQVKIRGFRIELEEIENRLLEHEQIKEAVVIVYQDSHEEKYLCAYIVPTLENAFGNTLSQELREYLSQKLPDYMIPSYFIRLEKIPLNPNGKVERRELPIPETAEFEEVYAPPRDETEAKLAAIWSEVLGINPSAIGINDNFFQRGGHSLKGTVLISKIHKAFNVMFSLGDIFKAPTIRKISRHINESIEEKFRFIEKAEKKEYYGLSSAQKRLYILDQVEFASTNYNIPEVYQLTEEPDTNRLKEAFRQLIQRHDSFRTSFITVNDEPVQQIHDKVEFNIEYYEKEFEVNDEEKTTYHRPGTHLLSSDAIRHLSSEFIRPFDLSTAPLLRAELIKIQKAKPLLLVDMHHIISDGISMEIFKKELAALYDSKELSHSTIQYKDYAQWQYRESRREKIKRQEEYWLKEFKGEIPVLSLPNDFPRPATQSFEGNILSFELKKNQTEALNRLAATEQATLFMVLFAIFNILLAKLSGQENIIVGTPTAGRRHADLEYIIGMFVNTLALKNYPSGEKKFNEFLTELKIKTLQAFENQEYQFEDLVELLNVIRDAGRNPLFDVVFALQNMEEKEIHQSGLQMTPYKYLGNIAKFDLTLFAEETGAGISFNLGYCTRLFKEETMVRFTKYFQKIVSSVLENPEKKISAIEIILPEEKEQILFVFNDTSTVYPKDKTIQELFEKQVEKTPDNIAIVGVHELNEEKHNRSYGFYSTYLSYKELNQQANQLAYLLIEKGVHTETIVGIMLERSIRMAVGVLAILKAGGAYLPISPDYPKERIHYMLTESKTNVLVTTENLFKGKMIETREKEIAFLNTALSNSPIHPSTLLPFYPSNPLNLAYIIYTSGTTGGPKGAMVKHLNVVRLVKNTNFIQLEECDRILQTGALEFDASTFEIWGSLLNGLELYLVSKEIILSPLKLKETLQKHKITVIWLTAPLFNQLLDEEIEIFRGLKSLLVGGDVLSPPHINRLRKQFPQLNIINGYGPTENTTFSTTFLIDKEYKRNIPIGKPIANSTVYIVDRFNKILPIGIPGELIVGGAGAARGYLNNPELTGEKFDHDLWDLWDYHAGYNKSYRSYTSYILYKTKKKEKKVPGKRIYSVIYRTGDLARWQADGNIEFIGRVDFQVKIRGFRIELEEIENRLLEHEKIKEAVVIIYQDSHEEKYLCAYIVPTLENAFRNTLSQELREYLSQKLPDYMIPSYFIRLEKIPLNPNGKVERRELPVPETAEFEEVYTPPRDETEAKLAVIWSEVLGISHSTIGIDDNFFQRGGHSLKGTVLISKIHKVFNAKLSLGDIFKAPTIRKISRYINESIEDKFRLIEKAEKKEYYALSSAQKRLYILDQMEPGSMAYNMPMFYQLETGCEIKRLQDAFQQLIRRHESFRTSFITVNNEPVQKIHDKVEPKIEYYEKEVEVEEEGTKGLDQLPIEPKIHNWQLDTSTIKNFIRPFDLSKAPLLRVGLVKLPHTPAAPGAHPSQKGIENKYLLMMDMHHIISDGVSMEIFQKELTDLYDLNPLPPLNIQYKDYAQWHHQEKRKEKIKDQQDYWLKEFSGDIPVLNLPLDYVRPAVQSFEGETLHFEIGEKQTGAIIELAKKEGATLFMILTALFNILLKKLSGQEDIVIGTPAAGRRHADLQNTIGMSVNTLAMRNFPSGTKPFNRFLSEIKTKTLEVFENQEYQFEELVERLEVTRDAARNPLFDVMFTLQNIEKTKTRQRKLQLKPYYYEDNISKFDIVMGAKETPQGLAFELGYCTKLFKKDTIKRFIKYIEKIICAVIKNPEAKISSIEILTNEETREILYGFNKREPEFPIDKTIPGLFSQQVGRTPDHIAVVQSSPIKLRDNFIDMTYISYGQLNEKSNRLAGLLMEKGIKPGTIVGILIERSIEMIVGIIAILKAGGAYLPINPKNPPERIKYLLEDSGVGILLTTTKLQVKAKEGENIEIIDIYNLSSLSTAALTPTCQVSPTNLAYIIYTSGSTGNPKGVPITHSNLSPLLHWGYKHLGLNSHDRVVQNLSYFFDWSVWEIFITLTTGAGLFTASDDMLLNPEVMIEFNRKNGITALHITPTQFQALINFKGDEAGQDETVKLETLKYLLIGAEKLTYELVRRSFEPVNNNCRVFNMYGPTEATIISAVLEIDRGDYQRFRSLSSVPIGIPAGNAKLLVMDKYLKLCPVNVLGELYIGGDSLSRGYFNNPELTAEKFCHDLWDYHDRDHRSYRSHKSYTSNLSYYRTGDLVRWLADGNIEFLGRADQQVKIRGLRIELGEIEARLVKHKDIKEVVVTTTKAANGELYLCAFYVPRPGEESGEPLEIQDLRDYLSGQMADYMIPSYFIPIPQIPLNPNGKVDLKALPTPEITRDIEYTPPRNTMEKKLVKIWSEILGIEEPSIGIDDNFFRMGGHSLNATRLMAEIYKSFNARISQVEFFNTPNIRGLSKHVKEALKNISISQSISITPGEKKEYYPLSPAQKKFYVLNQLEPRGTVYHMYDVFELEGSVDGEKVENTFKKLIQRHDAFRTSFIVLKGEPVQKIHDEVEFKIEYFQVEVKVEVEEIEGTRGLAPLPEEPAARNPQPATALIGSFIRPFDLSQAPLLRVGLIKREGEAPLFLFDMHHIISDAVSFELTVDEFLKLLAGKDNQLPGLKYRYKDYAEWQEKLVQSGEIKRQEEYWTREFSGPLPVIDLPMDYPRPAFQSFEGDKVFFKISLQEVLTLKEYAREEEATMFMVVLALFNVFLSKLSGQEDIIIGTPIAGRKYSELYNIIGVFINTLSLRNYPKKNESFEQLLKEVRTRTLEAFENQDYQFDDLVKKLQVRRDSSRNPIFSVLYAFISPEGNQEQTEQTLLAEEKQTTPGQVDDLDLQNNKYLNYKAMLDLILTVAEMNNTRELIFNFGYCTKLFKKESIETFVTYFKEIIAAVVKNKRVLLKDIKISLDLEEAKMDIPQIEFGF